MQFDNSFGSGLKYSLPFLAAASIYVVLFLPVRELLVVLLFCFALVHSRFLVFIHNLWRKINPNLKRSDHIIKS